MIGNKRKRFIRGATVTGIINIDGTFAGPAAELAVLAPGDGLGLTGKPGLIAGGADIVYPSL